MNLELETFYANAEQNPEPTEAAEGEKKYFKLLNKLHFMSTKLELEQLQRVVEIESIEDIVNWMISQQLNMKQVIFI